MKKANAKKLTLGKIRIASLSNTIQADIKGGAQRSAACISRPITCLSQGNTLCSEDVCRY
ncbi:hypothetical protein F0L74_15735 [Chitinophaga agrisoli]|uniref:Uncharacterized protein n=1 Tax=Chitinophaga agrisoli TaxID=2607653 RepID=A0A5B2VQP7_9BACT|nr:class I lanthipeptide [Chitinophaga agrisoli]KAA2241355.1 hypothetical protein F0L74_15735 [Chitinophaga agrisoli]